MLGTTNREQRIIRFQFGLSSGCVAESGGAQLTLASDLCFVVRR